MIYLASPYTSPYASVRSTRFHAVRNYANLCMQRGETVISPIAYGHQFEINYNTGVAFKYWKDLSERLILASNEVRVLQLPGWKKSFGVAHEIEFAKHNGIKVTYADPV